MYDRETISLWIHTTGAAVIGEHDGETLSFVPSTVTTWKRWRSEHDKSLVLNVRKGMNHRFNLKKNARGGGLSVGQPNGALKFYPLSGLQKQKVVNDELDGKSIVVAFDADDWVFAAFERGGLTFSWQDGKMVDQNGQRWSVLGGTSGEATLAPVPAVTWLEKAWKRFYPDGTVYAAPSRSPQK